MTGNVRTSTLPENKIRITKFADRHYFWSPAMPKRTIEEATGGAAAGGAAEETLEITKEGEMPRKCFYRSRAHCNPLSHNDAFDYPVSPPGG